MRKLKKAYQEASGRELAAACIRVALDTKAEDVIVRDVRGIATFTDYFVVMSGRSTRHVQGLADAIERHLRAKRVSSKHSEGLQEGLWVLLDFEDVVVHIFYRETRRFYDLEGLWHDVPRIAPQDLLAEERERKT